MSVSASKGNDPKRWEALLVLLDERLQLGLLGYVSRVSSYHFEGEVLFLEPNSPADAAYLKRDAVLRQLELFAQEATKVEHVKIKTTTP